MRFSHFPLFPLFLLLSGVASFGQSATHFAFYILLTVTEFGGYLLGVT